jgi:hypothetical protein
MMPNFLIIGAMRAGTSSLYQYLKQHPEIYMSPVKEPEFFVPGTQWSQAITEPAAYEALFSGVSSEKAFGEASTEYLPNRGAAERIRRTLPDVKLIAVLRDPADRAYSDFLHRAREGKERLSDFGQAITKGQYRDDYMRLGFYHAHLMNYRELFRGEQLKVFLYDDLRDDPVRLTQNVFEFLGVNRHFVPDVSVKHNLSTVPRNRSLHALFGSRQLRQAARIVTPPQARRAIRRVISRWLTTRPEYPQAIRRQLIEMYRPDICKLQDLLQRDLTKWLN